MITVADLYNDAEKLKTYAESHLGLFGQVDRVALNSLDVIMAHPEGAELLSVAAGLCGITGLLPGTILGWCGAGKAILGLFAQNPSPVPAAAAAAA